MAKEKNLTAVTSVAAADFARVVTSAGASVKATFANVAKYIIETYNGSTVAGSAQSVKAALDSLNSKTYSTSGLTYAGCSHTRGGYCVQGNLVIVNISVNTTSAGATVSGFPAPQFTIGFGGYDGSNEKPIFAYMNTSGTLAIPGAITQLGSFNISLTYVKA